MTLTFVLRLRTAPTGESPTTIAGRVEIVQRGTEYTVHNLAELEAVLVKELALAGRGGEDDSNPNGNLNSKDIIT